MESAITTGLSAGLTRLDASSTEIFAKNAVYTVPSGRMIQTVFFESQA